MSFTQADLTRIDRAIASGARSVTIGDNTVIYNTGDSLIRQRQLIVAELNAAAAATAGKTREKQRYLYQSGRGYD
jgi:hypothetical protein